MHVKKRAGWLIALRQTGIVGVPLEALAISCALAL